MNTGVGRLIVAGGPPLDHPDAVKMAVHGRHVLDAGVSYETLDEALSGFAFVLGTTSRTIEDRRSITAREAAAEALAHAHLGPVALLFGNEKSGLSNEELHRVDRIVSIPTAIPHGSLNLAQAVMILTYELYATWLAGGVAPARGAEAVVGPDNTARWGQELIRVLDRAGLFLGHGQERTVARLKDILARLDLRSDEVGLLRTLVRKLQWAGVITDSERHPRLPD